MDVAAKNSAEKVSARGTPLSSTPSAPDRSRTEAWLDRIGVPRARVFETRKEYGNVGPANVLRNLDCRATRGHFKPGDKILLFGQGSGMSVGALLRWHGRANAGARATASLKA